jgi:hypothetical protein
MSLAAQLRNSPEDPPEPVRAVNRRRHNEEKEDDPRKETKIESATEIPQGEGARRLANAATYSRHRNLRGFLANSAVLF